MFRCLFPLLCVAALARPLAAEVPLDANSQIVANCYRELVGQMQLVVPADQGDSGWPGFFQCQELVDFVPAHAKP